MAESNINLIIRTKREGDATEQALDDLREFETGLSDIEKAMAGTRTTIGNLDQDVVLFGQNIGTTADLLDGLGVSIPVTPMQLFGQAIQAGGQFAAEAIGDYTEYVQTIDQLAAFASTSTEEMSALYQVSQNMRVEAGQFEEAMKQMVEHGMTPSITQLGNLSDEYLALKDPVEKSQFLIENFGEAGQSMAEIMGLGSEAISGMADEMENWMVVTGKSEQDVQDYQAAMKSWNDAWMEIKFTLASELLPIISAFIDGLIETQEEVETSKTGILSFIPALDGLYKSIALVKNIGGNLGWWEDSSPSYGGARAEGGDLLPNMTYKVGEREVEYLSLPFGASMTPASGAGGENISIVYSPMISTMDRYEAENVLLPIIRQAMRRS